MNQFDLNYQYQLYLKRVGLSEDKMHPVQRVETKQAFMGACGQILFLMRDEVSKHDERKAIEIFENMINQVGNFFLKPRRN